MERPQDTGASTQEANVDGLTLEYSDRGAGEPVLLIHGGLCTALLDPLLDEPALGAHRLIAHHRAGYAGSSHPWDAGSLSDHARHCRELLRHLGVERAHVIGHSSGANIALQLAFDAPKAVHSLALLEPALMAVPSRAAWGREVALPALECYRAGDRAGAVAAFLDGVAGAGALATVEGRLPGTAARMVADAPAFFEQELPAVQQWAFGAQQAARVAQPALAVLGGRSRALSPVWEQRQALLLSWLAEAEPYVLKDATQILMSLEQPDSLAEALQDFFARHPLRAVRA